MENSASKQTNTTIAVTQERAEVHICVVSGLNFRFMYQKMSQHNKCAMETLMCEKLRHSWKIRQTFDTFTTQKCTAGTRGARVVSSTCEYVCSALFNPVRTVFSFSEYTGADSWIIGSYLSTPHAPGVHSAYKSELWTWLAPWNTIQVHGELPCFWGK